MWPHPNMMLVCYCLVCKCCVKSDTYVCLSAPLTPLHLPLQVFEGTKQRGMVDAVNKTYPGRASISVHLDLLMTLLHWGSQGWRKVSLSW